MLHIKFKESIVIIYVRADNLLGWWTVKVVCTWIN